MNKTGTSGLRIAPIPKSSSESNVKIYLHFYLIRTTYCLKHPINVDFLFVLLRKSSRACWCSLFNNFYRYSTLFSVFCSFALFYLHRVDWSLNHLCNCARAACARACVPPFLYTYMHTYIISLCSCVFVTAFMSLYVYLFQSISTFLSQSLSLFVCLPVL